MPRHPLPVLAAILALAAGCTAAGTWHAGVGRDHPLVGRIFTVDGMAEVSEPDLTRRLAASDFVLLGEKHDNPDHHRLQARLVTALARAGRRPVVAFEMLTEAQAPALEAHLRAHPTDAAGIGAAVGWADSGWPPWTDYRPIAEAALREGLPLATANAASSTVRDAARDGVDILDPGLVARTGLDRALSPAIQREMTQEANDAHCGVLPPAALAPMVLAQRVRDAVMADRLATAARNADGGVLIAGAGHVRDDRGVPAILARLEPGAMIVTVAFIEVADDRPAPGDYASRFGANGLPFDYVWFTPRLDDADPCVKFADQLKRLRPGGSGTAD